MVVASGRDTFFVSPDFRRLRLVVRSAFRVSYFSLGFSGWFFQVFPLGIPKVLRNANLVDLENAEKCAYSRDQRRRYSRERAA